MKQQKQIANFATNFNFDIDWGTDKLATISKHTPSQEIIIIINHILMRVFKATYQAIIAVLERR